MPPRLFDPSVTDLLLVVVCQLGLCLALLAVAAAGTQGSASPLTVIGRAVGIVTALAALSLLLVRWRVRTGQ